jgi:hypothetical protein
MACCTFMPKSITLTKVWRVIITWSSPPGLPVIMNGWPSFITSVLSPDRRRRRADVQTDEK